MLLLGISGCAGSGKDTVASILTENYGFRHTAQADPMKLICRELYGFSNEQLWGPSSYRNAPDLRYPREHTMTLDGCMCCGISYTNRNNVCCYLTPRYALQTLGANWGRDCYQDIWINAAIAQAHKLGGRMVITDIRFQNEIDSVSKEGGILIRVIRPSAGLHGAPGAHISESEMDTIPNTRFDHVIINDGSLDELKRLVDQMMGILT